MKQLLVDLSLKRIIALSLIYATVLIVFSNTKTYTGQDNSSDSHSLINSLSAPQATFTVQPGVLCPQSNLQIVYGYNINTFEDAVKDTIPGEWWKPSDYGVTTIPYPALKSAAIIVRSRLKFENTSQGGYRYVTANINYHAGETQYQYPECHDWEMNTILPDGSMVTSGVGRNWGSGSTYNTNGAVNETAQAGDQHLVDITPESPPFLEWNLLVERSTVFCNNASLDYEFCALQAMSKAPNNATDNRVRRINTNSPNIIKFQAEAFDTRYQGRPLNDPHYWYCFTGSGFRGYTGGCYMEVFPDTSYNNPNYGQWNSGYVNGSAELRYTVPFPTTGKYWYVWIKGYGCGVNSDSVHVGIDNQGLESLSSLSGWDGCFWQWKSIRMNGQRPKAYIPTLENNT